MNSPDFLIFTVLFKEAYQKCFGDAMKSPLTETESKLLCNHVLDKTGLSVGWKSVKNYSIFINDTTAGKQENPSVATMDTLARYVLNAPYTSELQRKNNESHYPYWFLYKEKFKKTPVVKRPHISLNFLYAVLGVILLLALLAAIYKIAIGTKSVKFTDHFTNLNEQSMLDNGWFVKAKDAAYWNRRHEKPGDLTLFTLNGDSWPDSSSKPIIKNLLLRPIVSDCFAAEVHLENFVPHEEWQQAGILLMEDTTFTGKTVRLSLAYNDFFGGIKQPKEILIQAITSLGNGFGKPEEIAHKVVFYPDSAGVNGVLLQNLQNTSLRIEKYGSKYRFLYSAGIKKNGAFKEVVTQEIAIKPKYIGLFAIKGFTNSSVVPVRFKFFRLTGEECK
ncbi:MAG: hypothetical protein ABIN13_12535 [Mucilaginibacter sp.]